MSIKFPSCSNIYRVDPSLYTGEIKFSTELWRVLKELGASSFGVSKFSSLSGLPHSEVSELLEGLSKEGLIKNVTILVDFAQYSEMSQLNQYKDDLEIAEPENGAICTKKSELEVSTVTKTESNSCDDGEEVAVEIEEEAMIEIN